MKHNNYSNINVRKLVEDYKILSFKDFLIKYYSLDKEEAGLHNWNYRWNYWLNQYVKLIFNGKNYNDFIKNFGYVSIDKYNFEGAIKLFNEIENDSTFDIELKMFFAFIKGTGFFEKHKLTFEK